MSNSSERFKPPSICRTKDGTVKGDATYEYDEKGNKIKEIQRKADGSVDLYYEYEYNDKGEKIKEICKNPDGTIKK